MSSTDTASESEDQVSVQASGAPKNASGAPKNKIELFSDFLNGDIFKEFLTFSKLQVGIAKREALELQISHRVYLGFYHAIQTIARECAGGKRIFDSDNFDELVRLITYFDSDINAPPVTNPPDRSQFFHRAQISFQLDESSNDDQATLTTLQRHLDSFIYSLKGEAKGRGETSIGIPEIAALYKYTIQFHLPKYVHFIRSLFSNLLTPFPPNQPRMQFEDGTGALDFAKSSKCFLCTRPKDREKVFKNMHLNAHLKKTHRFELFICPECNHKLYSRQTLLRHTKVYHPTDPNQLQKVQKRIFLKQKSKTNYKIPKSPNKNQLLTSSQQIHFALPSAHEYQSQDHLQPTATTTSPPSSSSIQVIGNEIFDGEELLIAFGESNQQSNQSVLTVKPSSSSTPPPSEIEPNHKNNELEEGYNELLELLQVDPCELEKIKEESENKAEQFVKESLMNLDDDNATTTDPTTASTTASTLALPPPPLDNAPSPTNREFQDVPESIQGEHIIIISPNTFMKFDSSFTNQLNQAATEET